MAENKTQPTDASVDEVLAAVDNDTRRTDARRVLELMRDVTVEHVAKTSASERSS